MATLVEPNVFVSMMSAPASRYCRWMSRIASGWVIASMSMKFCRSREWSANCRPAKSGFLELQGMDHRAHRPVENQNPPG